MLQNFTTKAGFTFQAESQEHAEALQAQHEAIHAQSRATRQAQEIAAAITHHPVHASERREAIQLSESIGVVVCGAGAQPHRVDTPADTYARRRQERERASGIAPASPRGAVAESADSVYARRAAEAEAYRQGGAR